MPTRIFHCERAERLWPYVCSGLRCFLRQQMDAVPLLVVLTVLHDGVDGFEGLERLLKTLYTLRAGESQGPWP